MASGVLLRQLPEALPSAAAVVSVLKLFVLPVGAGIPGGVLLAQSKGLPWLVTVLLYLVSDILLALVFEPVLRLVVFLCGKAPFLARFRHALGLAMARNASYFSRFGAGPVALVMVAFGVDPMTGRASALAAGYGFIGGWAIAIAGDMLYFGVVALSALRLNAYIRDPDTTMWIILIAMLGIPQLIRFVRSRRSRGPINASN